MGSHIPGVLSSTGNLVEAGETEDRHGAYGAKRINRLSTVIESVHGGEAARAALKRSTAGTGSPDKSPAKGTPDKVPYAAFNSLYDEQAAQWATFAYAWNALVGVKVLRSGSSCLSTRLVLF